jgi:hypothetical protein
MAAGTANPSSMPLQVDASGAATYTLGEGGPNLNGVVEVSLDDANFGAPRVATLPADPVNDNHWQLQLSGSELVSGPHTAYVRQRISGRDPSPVVSVSYTVAATVEQPVTSLVSLLTANPRSSLGVSSYDVSMKNTSTQTIFAPLRLELASITSASGTVTVANADNTNTGVGASWDFSTKLGADNALTANETSLARTVKFNNPRNEPFTVTFNVIGNLPRGSSSSSSPSSSSLSSSSAPGSGTEPGSSSPSTPGTGAATTGIITNPLFKVTYNPLLNTVTIQLVQP